MYCTALIRTEEYEYAVRLESTYVVNVHLFNFRHTGVVVYGNEYYFGGGIQQSPAGSTPYGTPMRIVELGITHVPQDVFESYLEEISPRYTAETYSLLNHNCNNFSNEIAQFLVGTSIPDYIIELPNEVISSPMGAMMCKFCTCVFLFCYHLCPSLWTLIFFSNQSWRSCSVICFY